MRYNNTANQKSRKPQHKASTGNRVLLSVNRMAMQERTEPERKTNTENKEKHMRTAASPNSSTVSAYASSTCQLKTRTKGTREQKATRPPWHLDGQGRGRHGGWLTSRATKTTHRLADPTKNVRQHSPRDPALQQSESERPQPGFVGVATLPQELDGSPQGSRQTVDTLNILLFYYINY